jgi:hypothetical protein
MTVSILVVDEATALVKQAGDRVGLTAEGGDAIGVVEERCDPGSRPARRLPQKRALAGAVLDLEPQHSRSSQEPID